MAMRASLSADHSGVLGWQKTRACTKTVFYLSYFMLNAIPKKWFDLFL
jgi:hypothetical protein